jgi:3-deoxy-D-manno-octulosonic acid (KDO) 8-phosphate synthase
MQKIVVVIRNGSHKWQIIASNCKLNCHKTVLEISSYILMVKKKPKVKYVNSAAFHKCW